MFKSFQTGSKQTLTIGDANTGNIVFGQSITSGTWNGTVISPVYGGTGVANNVASTLTISGNYATTLTVTGTTGVTLPTTGTLATLAQTETLSNKTLTAPKFADLGFIADPSGNEYLIFDSVASAVNEFTMTNSATGASPSLSATGGDTNIGLNLNSKGTGTITLTSAATTGTATNIVADALTTGTGLYLSSTSTALSSGSLFSMYWNPGSSTTATGNLFNINVGSNALISGNIFGIQNNGSNLFTVNQTQITSALPHAFTASGDVNLAYDLIFTNQTTGNIQSYDLSISRQEKALKVTILYCLLITRVPSWWTASLTVLR